VVVAIVVCYHFLIDFDLIAKQHLFNQEVVVAVLAVEEIEARVALKTEVVSGLKLQAIKSFANSSYLYLGRGGGFGGGGDRGKFSFMIFI
jgi:uncharacterized small protein (DUF1192 family)